MIDPCSQNKNLYEEHLSEFIADLNYLNVEFDTFAGEHRFLNVRQRLIKCYEIFCDKLSNSRRNGSKHNLADDGLDELKNLQDFILSDLIAQSANYAECHKSTHKFMVKVVSHLDPICFKLSVIDSDGGNKDHMVDMTELQFGLLMLYKTNSLESYITTEERPRPMNLAAYTGLMFTARVMCSFYKHYLDFEKAFKSAKTNVSSHSSPCSVAKAPVSSAYVGRSLFPSEKKLPNNTVQPERGSGVFKCS